MHTTRLAPSPTGSLHLGNAFAFVLNWALARKRGWRVVLRIEDLDESRVHEGMAQQAIDTLRWLGLDWDDEPVIQTQRMEAYHAAMRALASAKRVYPCELSRREIEDALSAPHASPTDAALHAPIRPETFPNRFDAPGTSWRFAVEPSSVEFTDQLMGPQRFDPNALGGDFIVWTKRRAPSYQLAVVVDDHDAGVTQVVRGRDLLDSAARQLLLYRALGLGPEPVYTHLPLVLGHDGRRLAKRDQDTHIASYSRQGGPERVIGLIARWAGIVPEATPMTISAFLDAFDPDTLPVDDLVFSKEDARWLRS
ncbi:MAG: glutamate--tRNA ligase family protein [Phycisphaerales bacterium JB052]